MVFLRTSMPTTLRFIIYGSCSPTDVHGFSLKISECINDVASWMRCRPPNRLQLNPGKTELLWCSTDRRRHRLPTFALTIDSTSTVDCDLMMRTRVCRTISYCFTMLRQLRSIRYLVSASVFQSLVTTLVLCRLDYGNTLVGLPIYLQRRLQSVQNAAARLIFRLRRSDHIKNTSQFTLATCARAHNLKVAGLTCHEL